MGLTERTDLPAGDARRLNQEISAFRQRFTGEVVDDIGLSFVWCETDRFCTVARQRQQRQLRNQQRQEQQAARQRHAVIRHQND